MKGDKGVFSAGGGGQKPTAADDFFSSPFFLVTNNGNPKLLFFSPFVQQLLHLMLFRSSATQLDETLSICSVQLRDAIDHNCNVTQPRVDMFIFLARRGFGDETHQWAVIVSLTAATLTHDDDGREATFF